MDRSISVIAVFECHALFCFFFSQSPCLLWCGPPLCLCLYPLCDCSKLRIYDSEWTIRPRSFDLGILSIQIFPYRISFPGTNGSLMCDRQQQRTVVIWLDELHAFTLIPNRGSLSHLVIFWWAREPAWRQPQRIWRLLWMDWMTIVMVNGNANSKRVEAQVDVIIIYEWIKENRLLAQTFYINTY